MSSTYWCSASNWLRSEAAWATRSSRRSPSTARCSERTRERGKASTRLVSRATTATAPAAIATMPTVLVRSCTEERIRAGAVLLERDRVGDRVVVLVLLARNRLDRGHDRLRALGRGGVELDRAVGVLAGERLGHRGRPRHGRIGAVDRDLSLDVVLVVGAAG